MIERPNRTAFPRLAFLALAVAGLLLVVPNGSDAQVLKKVELEARPDPAAGQLAEIQAYLNSLRSMKARFVQRGPDGKRAEGSFYMERPGRLRFEYKGDVPILIVADGKTLNLIDYDIGEITRWPVSDTPLAFLVAEDIDLSKYVLRESVQPGGLANLVSITARDPKKPTRGALTLIFSRSIPAGGDQPAYKLTAWRVLDAQGGLTTVRLFDTEANPDIDPIRWSFEDPRGKRARRPKRR
ncbi:MAG: outer membrane lipoprotein carrier protein LolA [Sphingomonadales bacterium]